MVLTSGETLSAYRISGLLGKGGWATFPASSLAAGAFLLVRMPGAAPAGRGEGGSARIRAA